MSEELECSGMTEAVAARYAGTRVQRVEDTRLLTGRGTFVDDISRPGMLHACFVRSPFARAGSTASTRRARWRCPGAGGVYRR
ncbi:aldehyde oxidase and xanthine dehydrogenase, a/b hammerhead domain protein [Mycobacterium xenopi 4042]|uniref:Aldehyde oxidase and xanthine dehydrogenase, a/b hammerhead domain protein n=1 Tax=Mycobacterium xenopi 4042 TaxID=1299334 RepID=X8DM61_MYCXE|nr:aldehyde oxidase and xanthine dehydrogenase, a/b hammerhead domain protein [Mycobacterium xenopi 4042]